jgi:hypothetical protein
MENSRFQNIVIIILVGLILAGVAFYLRYQATREEPPPPGYYTGPMLPKSQRMGPMPGMPSANSSAPSPTPPQGGQVKR